MISNRVAALLLATSLTQSVAQGQTPTEWNTVIRDSSTGPSLSGTPAFGGTALQSYPKLGIVWTIRCVIPVSCKDLRPALYEAGTPPRQVDTLEVLPDPDLPATDSLARFQVIGNKTRGRLELTLSPPGRAAITVRAELVQDSIPAGTAAATTINIDASCPTHIPPRPDSPADTAFVPHFFVDYLGNVLKRPTWPVDDRSQVRVTVLAKRDALPQLRITRRSAFRDVGAISIVGAGIDVSKLIRHAEGEPVDLACRSVTLADFASGKGEVEIALVNDQGTVQPLGSFDFAVNPTYTGAFSMGALRTTLLDPEIGLAFNGSDTVITAKTDGGVSDDSHRILYAVFYTYYIWGRRDLEKPRPFWERFNPMMGVILNDIPNNFVAGATMDLLDGVFISAGAHAGNVHTLDPDSGLDFGEPYAGTAEQLPVVRRWRTKFFFGVAVDLRAAAELFKAVLGGGT